MFRHLGSDTDCDAGRWYLFGLTASCLALLVPVLGERRMTRVLDVIRTRVLRRPQLQPVRVTRSRFVGRDR